MNEKKEGRREGGGIQLEMQSLSSTMLMSLCLQLPESFLWESTETIIVTWRTGEASTYLLEPFMHTDQIST